MTAAILATIRLADYRPPEYLIDQVDLVIRLAKGTSEVTSKLSMRPNPAVTGQHPLRLDGDGLELTSLLLDGKPLPDGAYTVEPRALVIHNPPPEPFTIEIGTRIEPEANTQLSGLYRSTGAWCTQCEAEGFRRITYFLDRPDVLSVYTTRIEAERKDAPILLGNGNPVEAGPLPGTSRHFAVWHDPFPKPCYLFAIVAGDLGVVSDRFVTMSGREVALNIYCEHGREARCGYAMDALKRSMRWDETAFGREYDLDVFNIVAVSDFNMGAMENKGLNIFNDKYVLVDEEAATDVDFAHVETVIAHEYLHNWTGNRITCRDWFQLCLKEGLTVFRDQEFSSAVRSAPVKRIADVRTLKARQFPEDAGPLAHPVRPDNYREINNFYTATVYEKGAEIIRMLKTVLGEDGFQRGMTRYFDENDGRAATVEDFLDALVKATGADLSQFKLWYAQAGTPEITAHGEWDAGARRYTLDLAQHVPATPGQPVKQPLHIPLRFGLVGPNGADIEPSGVSGAEVTGDVIHLTRGQQRIVFEGVAVRPVPSLFRGFSAPVRLSLDLGDDDLLFLARTDRDPFNRWQAVETLLTRHLVAAGSSPETARALSIDRAVIETLGDIAEDATMEPAFRAQVLTLPAETEIANAIGREIDPDAIAIALARLRADIARQIGGRLKEARSSVKPRGTFSPEASEAGRRALANVALDLMTGNGDPSAIRLTNDVFYAADNMTDRMAALSILCRGVHRERIAALDSFEQRYRSDHLVLDKWLALEAMVPAPETLQRVEALLDHPFFSMRNPNRVRALVGAFAMSNATQFNRADGKGYDFMANFILTLDKSNAQTAARLLIAFRSWRALEPKRRAQAEAALKRIATADRLSPDVGDIIARTLAAPTA